MRRFFLPLLGSLALTACASAGQGPSLAPRAAEAIDPRVPVVDGSAALAADAGLSARLAALRDQALAAAGRAEPAIRAAAAATSSAGGRESDSWIAAQQLVSAAIAERAAFSTALGDLDRLVAERIQSGGRLVPQDVLAARAVADQLSAVDRRQSDELAALQARLR
ncbi:hypothetical protein GCM10022280_10720 [Sphingomonas swuensis]|uniref:DUF4398 domain-containing protein n=1 Tax=Sphingomonas swuensis TaxID=977800 RepID=A0ABP7SND0_9SPHN